MFSAEAHSSPQQTAFLIPNLHCPSCVSTIENALNRLEPRPFSISHSIVSHTVTVTHTHSLTHEIIAKTLEDEGFEIGAVIAEPFSQEPTVLDATNAQEQAPWPLGGGFQRWRSAGDISRDERKRKMHQENCEQCRSKAEAERKEKLLAPRADSKTTPSSAVDDTPSADGFLVVDSASAIKQFEATLAIDGMSCSSCVAKISRRLEEEAWVQSVNVNLLTNSATVKFVGQGREGKLIELVRDLGYDARPQEVDEVEHGKESSQGPSMGVWKASYAVGGITCSSCVSSITRALERLPWLKSVDVNLIANSAVVIFEDKSHLTEIQDTIEDIGYEAKLDDVVQLGSDREQTSRRTVSIRIEGMYCEHCPGRVKEAISSLGEQVKVVKLPSVDDPILKVTYIPNSPRLTIRKLLETISKADTAFKPSIYHPMTIEERSRLMHAREQRHIMFRLILSITIAIPTFIIGIVYMNLLSAGDPNRQYLMHPVGGVSRAEWALFIMATPVYFFAADVFHRRMLKEMWALWRPGSRSPLLRRFFRFGSMDMLISLGTSIAYFSSMAELIIAATGDEKMVMDDANQSYFDSVVFLTMFLLAGRLIEAYSKAKTGDAVALLGKLRPTEAILVTREDGGPAETAGSEASVQKINVDLLEFGDIVKVPHGVSPPCDGTIVAGTAKFDESSLTGESKLVSKSVGDIAYSGTVNQGGAISIRVTGVAGGSLLDQIMKVVREGQTRRAPVERIADVITGYFVPVVTLIAVGTWIVWLALGLSGTLPESFRDTHVGGWPFWSLQFAIAIFVIACPCGIGLAAPTALFVGGGLAAKYGILVKGGGEAFQEASKLDCIVFDKTGTLTQGGEPVITDYSFLSGVAEGESAVDEETLLSVVKTLEEDSSHPIAKAVVEFCKVWKTTALEVRESSELAGRGMKGSFAVETLGNSIIEVLVGNEALMTNHHVIISNTVARTLNSWKTEAKSVVLAAARIIPSEKSSSPPAWSLSAIFSVSDPLRSEAPAVVHSLQRRGIDVWMISGDNPVTAYAVGAEVGIPREKIIAGVLPEQKAERIKYLQNGGSEGHRDRGRATVCMVGDGINDSPALTMADVGIAIGSGSDIAVSAAKFVLITSQLTSLLTLIDLSRVVFRRIKFNFLWAAIYNLAALPVAAGVLYPIKSNGSHVRLDPAWAALAMALSSISVVCSSLLLRSKIPVLGFRPQKMYGN